MPKQYPLSPKRCKVTQGNLWTVFCEFANKTTQQLYKGATPCMDDNQFKEEEMSQLENCPQFAHIMFKHVCIWLGFGDRDICGL